MSSLRGVLTLIAEIGGRGNENDERDVQADSELSLKVSRVWGAAGCAVLLAARKLPISANFCEQTLVPTCTVGSVAILGVPRCGFF